MLGSGAARLKDNGPALSQQAKPSLRWEQRQKPLDKIRGKDRWWKMKGRDFTEVGGAVPDDFREIRCKRSGPGTGKGIE